MIVNFICFLLVTPHCYLVKMQLCCLFCEFLRWLMLSCCWWCWWFSVDTTRKLCKNLKTELVSPVIKFECAVSYVADPQCFRFFPLTNKKTNTYTKQLNSQAQVTETKSKIRIFIRISLNNIWKKHSRNNIYVFLIWFWVDLRVKSIVNRSGAQSDVVHGAFTRQSGRHVIVFGYMSDIFVIHCWILSYPLQLSSSDSCWPTFQIIRQT